MCLPIVIYNGVGVALLFLCVDLLCFRFDVWLLLVLVALV